jgi:hypothetical protein
VILVVLLTGMMVTSQPADDTERAIRLAREALAATGLAAPFDVRRVEPAEWPDETLDCDPSRPVSVPPRPVTGFRVFLGAAGHIYRVHVGGGAALVCGPPLSTLPGDREDDVTRAPALDVEALAPEMKKLVASARADLAARQKLRAEAIEVITVEEVVWADTALGCPEPGMMYQHVLQPGTRIVLRAEGRRWRYHSGPRRAAFLCERPDGQGAPIERQVR